MKATGIVRRIDDLGRVVVPKESIFGDFEQKMAICGANFLGRQMEP